MKIVLSVDEIMDIVKKSFPPHLIPEAYALVGIESKEYPSRFELSFEKKEGGT